MLTFEDPMQYKIHSNDLNGSCTIPHQKDMQNSKLKLLHETEIICYMKQKIENMSIYEKYLTPFKSF